MCCSCSDHLHGHYPFDAPRLEYTGAPATAAESASAAAESGSQRGHRGDEGSQLQINGQPVAEKDLTARLEDIFKTRATKVVFVKGDPDVDYRYVAQAIDDAKGAGLDKVGIMTPKVEAGQLKIATVKMVDVRLCATLLSVAGLCET